MTDKLTQFTIIPSEKLDELMNVMNKIKEVILNEKRYDKNPLGDYISEIEAREILKRESTWFWNKRQSGELTGRKAGNKWFYKKGDILKFIENGKTIKR